MKYILNLLFLFPWALFAQEDPEALVLRGVALYDQGKYPEALKVLTSKMKEGKLTLVYGAKEERFNDAVVLQNLLN